MFHKLFRNLLSKKRSRKTPLAWLQVKREKSRLVVALAGIAFADVLMFVQLGLNDSLYDSAANFHNSLRGDLFIVNPISEALLSFKSTSRERLYQAAGVEGVESVNYMYIGNAQWRNPERPQRQRDVLVLGIDPTRTTLTISEVNQQLNQIQPLDQALFDRASRPEFGDVSALLEQTNPLPVQVNDKEFQVTGLFTLGVSFGTSGTMLVSDSTFLRLFSERQPEEIDVGIIELELNADVEQVQANLRTYLPNDVLVLTREEFSEREKQYWSSSTPTGFIFAFGTIVGFIVGIVIVYQILYSDVSDHLAEYATLKAMGYSNRYLVNILIQEALILATLGFIPGMLLSSGLYVIAGSATLLPIGMTFSRASFVLFLTTVMCTISGSIAMRKLQAADPADIF
ncbi:MAG: FtsX-like permease family protein [Leptolyngbyaceae cyanobacterium SL_5_9]|nr:FtsX-like permease family protein [Leptolyngbyaceae cyanobacterium SL_5_9]